MRVLSLFSGVGGIEIGMERAGFEAVAFSEYDPKQKRQYAAEVLAARWPGVPNLGDITTIDLASLEGIDVIAGGFPCQDISLAGKGGGVAAGARSGLWSYYADAIDAIKPRGVLIENVAALASRGLDIVLTDLYRLGYDAEWDVISAASVGAPHLRERMFIIAWPQGTALHGTWPEPALSEDWLEERAGVPRLAVGVEQRVARLRCLGNAVVPAVAEHVAGILKERLESDPNWAYQRGDVFTHDMSSDDLDRNGVPKYAKAAIFGILPPIAGDKLPRAGRMTNGHVVGRVRSAPQRFAKARALENMAESLRPRPDGIDGMWPTPVARDDGKTPEAHMAMKDRMGRKSITSLQVLSKVDQPRLLATLLPTPTGSDATGGPGHATKGGMNLRTAAKLLPTPLATDGSKDPSGSLTKIIRTGSAVGRVNAETDRNGNDQVKATGGGGSTRDSSSGSCSSPTDSPTSQRLLPTPAVNASKNSTAPPAMWDRNTPDVTVEMAKLEGYTRENRPKGGLNPGFVEWLQGFPDGWTDLRPDAKA